MKGTAGAAAGCNGEVLLAGFESFLLVGACNRVLETSRVGGVTCDGDINVLLPHDGNAFLYIVSAVAANLCTRAGRILGVAGLGENLQLAGEVIKLSLNIGEAVDTGDDLGSILAEAVQDNTKRLRANLVCLISDTDCTLSCSEGLVASQECEALGVLFQEHLAEVAMAKTYLTAVSNGTGDAEGLKAFADCGSSLVSLAAVLLDSDGSAYGVCPLRVLEADRLNALYQMINVQTSSLCDGLAFLNGGNTILAQGGKNLGLSSLIRFK